MQDQKQAFSAMMSKAKFAELNPQYDAKSIDSMYAIYEGVVDKFRKDVRGAGCMCGLIDDDNDDDDKTSKKEQELASAVFSAENKNRQGGNVAKKMITTKPIHSVQEFHALFFQNPDDLVQDYGCVAHERLAGSSIQISFREYEELLKYTKKFGKADFSKPKNTVVRKGGFTYLISVHAAQDALLQFRKKN